MMMEEPGPLRGAIPPENRVRLDRDALDDLEDCARWQVAGSEVQRELLDTPRWDRGKSMVRLVGPEGQPIGYGMIDLIDQDEARVTIEEITDPELRAARQQDKAERFQDRGGPV